MKNYASLKKHLLSFEENRKKSVSSFPSPNERVAYANAIAECFIPCAKKILAGYFEVKYKVGKEVLVRKIQPTVLELYYHEEKKGGFKDPIMYHTDYRKNTDKKADQKTYFNLAGISSLPYYPIGSLNPHTSGIDVTFENAKEQYRASFLIREYKVFYEKGTERTVKNSTDIYDDLLINGFSLKNSSWIKWVDNAIEVKAIKRGWRRNVPDYYKANSSTEFWDKKPGVEGNQFSIGGDSFAKCPLNWQFAKE